MAYLHRIANPRKLRGVRYKFGRLANLAYSGEAGRCGDLSAPPSDAVHFPDAEKIVLVMDNLT